MTTRDLPSACSICGTFDPDSIACGSCLGIVCKKCRKEGPCPFCSESYTPEAPRIFKTLLERTHKYCPMCGEYYSLQVLTHEKECPKRIVECPFCDERMSLAQFTQAHILTHTDDVLAARDEIQAIPMCATHFHIESAVPWTCDGGCGCTSSNPRIGGVHMRCLNCKDTSLCMSCFMDNMLQEGSKHKPSHCWTMLHPASTVAVGTMPNHAVELTIPGVGELQTETTTGNKLSAILFAKLMLGLPARPSTEDISFKCDLCEKEFTQKVPQWKPLHDEDEELHSLCTACYLNVLEHDRFHKSWSAWYGTEEVFKNPGQLRGAGLLLREPEE